MCGFDRCRPPFYPPKKPERVGPSPPSNRGPRRATKPRETPIKCASDPALQARFRTVGGGRGAEPTQTNAREVGQPRDAPRCRDSTPTRYWQYLHRCARCAHLSVNTTTLAQTTDSSKTGGQFTGPTFLGGQHTNPQAYGPLGSTLYGTGTLAGRRGPPHAPPPTPTGRVRSSARKCAPPPPAGWRTPLAAGTESNRLAALPPQSARRGEGGPSPAPPPPGGGGGGGGRVAGVGGRVVGVGEHCRGKARNGKGS